MDSHYYLESFSRSMDFPQQIPLHALPITVGRSTDCDFVINNSALSRRHARIEWHNDTLTLTDLGSTNGSFINHQRLTESAPIHNGDVVHFAGVEYCLKHAPKIVDDSADDRTRINHRALTSNYPIRGREFLELLEQGCVTSYQQCIMDRNGDLYGYELLGRGRHPNLNENPFELFMIAEQMSKEVELSELLRQRSFAMASAANINTPLFFNCHPLECQAPEKLFSGLQHLRRCYPDLRLIFEVHETAVTDIKLMKRIRAGLNDLNIGLAYDDFGAGQTRLLELAEVPPDILKFDICLVKGVGAKDSAHNRLLSSLNTLVQDMGIATLAEGIENKEVADACIAMGIDYFQGFYFGRPAEIHVDQLRT
ncbi:MAG: EAL domain-containing protein [Zhongshania sp.]|uniref:EAL domain-containing protein n=1 Tax=Zhongshania sp. TaxID=1971902 RepID=UPI00262F9AC3|nr:EAL domain-containing protein [Zhongshania sp.]MDF1691829.1 EAL domain-containing protein [Zhongshania sp.]